MKALRAEEGLGEISGRETRKGKLRRKKTKGTRSIAPETNLRFLETIADILVVVLEEIQCVDRIYFILCRGSLGLSGFWLSRFTRFVATVSGWERMFFSMVLVHNNESEEKGTKLS